MISEETIEAYASRLTVDVTNIDRLTPAQRDSVKAYGSEAEALLKNRELAKFIHHFKFALNDTIGSITNHTVEANAERIAIANQLSGIAGFVNSLNRAIYYKNKIIAWENSVPQAAKKSELKQVFDPNR